MSAPSLSGPPAGPQQPVFPTVRVTWAGRSRAASLLGDKAAGQAGLAGTSCSPLLPPRRGPLWAPGAQAAPPTQGWPGDLLGGKKLPEGLLPPRGMMWPHLLAPEPAQSRATHSFLNPLSARAGSSSPLRPHLS